MDRYGWVIYWNLKSIGDWAPVLAEDDVLEGNFILVHTLELRDILDSVCLRHQKRFSCSTSAKSTSPANGSVQCHSMGAIRMLSVKIYCNFGRTSFCIGGTGLAIPLVYVVVITQNPQSEMIDSKFWNWYIETCCTYREFISLPQVQKILAALQPIHIALPTRSWCQWTSFHHFSKWTRWGLRPSCFVLQQMKQAGFIYPRTQPEPWAPIHLSQRKKNQSASLQAETVAMSLHVDYKFQNVHSKM